MELPDYHDENQADAVERFAHEMNRLGHAHIDDDTIKEYNNGR